MGYLDTLCEKHGKKYHIKKAPKDLYIYDVIKINPTRSYLIKDMKKNTDGDDICPDGWMIVKVLGKNIRIKEGESGDVVIIDASRHYDIELSK